MKNKQTFYISLTIFAVFVLVLTFLSFSDYKEKPKTDIDKDDYGCLVSAGYSWNEEFEMCVIEDTYEECPEMEGDVCIMIYDPVCGLPNKQEYTNKCFACLDPEVTHTIVGVC